MKSIVCEPRNKTVNNLMLGFALYQRIALYSKIIESDLMFSAKSTMKARTIPPDGNKVTVKISECE